MKRLYDAINVGFDGQLSPVPRQTFRTRVSSQRYIDYIPVNFFLYNQNISGEDYIAVDELVFQAIRFPHNESFDRLALFALLLSEVGQWTGSAPEQSNPSEWARQFVIECLSTYEDWSSQLYSADAIENWLQTKAEFEGNTRKLSTNLSFVFKKANLKSLPSDQSLDWYANAIFLALDRYFLKNAPETPTLSWALDTLAENDVSDLSGARTELRLAAEKSVARLFLEVHGPHRFESSPETTKATIVAVLSRKPILSKTLPAIAEQWIKSRLFVEIAKDANDLQRILNTDYSAELNTAISRIHNSTPKPSINGDDAIRLFRNEE